MAPGSEAQGPPAASEQDVPSTRPRGRPRKSLASNEAASPATSITVASAKKGRGRPRKSAPMESESVSSVPTPLDGSSEEEYSTPATSKFPTPAASDIPGSAKPRNAGSSVEVQLPVKPAQQGLERERALRNSRFSMNSSSRIKNEIGDSDDDDNFDDSPDAQVARRLQREENVKAGSSSSSLNPTVGKRGRPSASTSAFPSPTLARASSKRGRASTGSNVTASRPAKRSKVVLDSDEEIDMDAEYALGAELESKIKLDSDEDIDMDKQFALGAEFEDGFGSSEADASYDGSDSDSDKPLKASRIIARKNLPKPIGRSTRSNNAAVFDPDESADEEMERLSVTHPESEFSSISSGLASATASDSDTSEAVARLTQLNRAAESRRAYRRPNSSRRTKKERDRLESHHPEIKTMWDDLEKMPIINAGRAPQPQTISRMLKPFQLEGLAWMRAMEQTEWKGGLLGDEMGLGKTIQAVSLIMSDYPAKQPSLVLVPPVALMQWQSEIKSYTDGTLKTFVFHGTNQKAKGITIKELKKYDVIMMSYNSLESMYRKQEKGFKRKDGIHKEQSVIHAINFHRIILDEAHSIKTRSTMTAKACFALKTNFRWCLTGTPLQNRIGEFFSLIRFLNIRPFASYLCKQCPCSTLEWSMDDDKRCSECNHAGMQHVSVFNQELLNPIQKYGNFGPGRDAFKKLRMMTDRIMLRRLKKDHTNSMELPVKEIYVDRQFFGEEENDFANSIMTNGQRKFDTYVAQGVLLNNYANIFGLIMQMRQVADHPDLILKKNAEGGQNVLVCCICDEPAEDTVRSRCKHDFCRACVGSYVRSTDEPDCPRCHIPLSIDLEQPEIEQDEALVKKTSIINRIKMENWTSSSKIELLVHELHKLRSDNATHKSIIFSQFTTMLQLIEWRLRRAGITTVMLDGSMTPAQRQASIEHFMNNVDVECFLVSLKAGGVALNLTEASRVFIVDP